MRTFSLTLICCLSLLNPYAQSVIKNLRGAIVEKGALESAIKQIVGTSRIVGLSVAIINDNKVVYNHTFGVKNRETNALLNDTTIMYAASFTKPISACIFLKLVEKGIFNLDTPVYKYLKKPIGEYEKWKDLATQMFTPQIRVNTKRGFGPLRDSITTENDNMQLAWGLGVGLLKTPYGKALFHTGHNEGWHNYFVAYPEKKTAIIFMSNSLNYGHVADKLLQVTIGDTVSPLKWLGFFDPEE